MTLHIEFREYKIHCEIDAATLNTVVRLVATLTQVAVMAAGAYFGWWA